MKEKPIVLKESFVFFSVLLFMSHASSKDLGVQGPLFAIEEENEEMATFLRLHGGIR